MTETEWLNSTDPGEMLKFLEGRTTSRKLRLFACGCCRRVWHLLEPYCGRFAIELLELETEELAFPAQVSIALGPVDRAGRTAQSRAVREAMESVLAAGALRSAEPPYLDRRAWWYEQEQVRELARTAQRVQQYRGGAEQCASSAARAVAVDGSSSGAEERAAQAALLRDVVGNPFQPVVVDPTWLAWNNRTVRKLAREIDVERRYAEVPILADALEEAGCTDEAILDHCRGPGPHIRGCWVVDALLDRQ
ncbi:MAG TPA: hypothetical protein VEL76_08120 [Gemmataceae bacterium]|nr:hypothetical protein [Gemmataceae bacterium]